MIKWFTLHWVDSVAAMSDPSPSNETSPSTTRLALAGGRELAWGQRTYVMGIINVTPDSFSGDGLAYDIPAIIDRAKAMEAEGADMLDVGAESTRPGSEPVPAGEELRRLLPALEAVASNVGIPISVDTYKAQGRPAGGGMRRLDNQRRVGPESRP